MSGQKITQRAPQGRQVNLLHTITLCRALTAEDPRRPDLARALHGLASALQRVGRYDEQLAAATESVALCKALLAENLRLLPDLAAAVRGFAGALDRVCRHDEQLAAATEAVALWIALTAKNPRHRPDLAAAVRGLAAALDRVCRHDEALAAAEEASPS